MTSKSSFTKNILTLSAGNGIAFIIPVILYPVLSRIFDRGDYALFGLYSSIFGFLEIASAGRYDFAVVMPKENNDAINLIGGALIISVCYSFLILLLVILFKDIVADKLNNHDLANWLYLLPIGLLFISVSKLGNAWLIRIKKFKSASINKASQKFAEGSAQMVFGFLKKGNGLILGDLAGRLFNAIFSMYQCTIYGLEKNKLVKSKIKENLLKYLEFPKYSIFPAMLNAMGGMLPVFIINIFYSVEVSGSFNFSRILLSVPFALIAAGISQVLMQQVSERRNKDESISKEIYSLAFRLFILSITGSLITYYFAPDLFEWLFGSKWRVAGEYTSILILSTSISLVISPFSILLPVLGKIKWTSLWQVFYFLAVSTLWFFGNFSISAFLIALVLIDVVCYIIYGVLIFKSVNNYESSLRDRLV